jgi:uncharacterized protein (TIGR02646 family)
MIHVDRSRVARPAPLSDQQHSPAFQERAAAALFYQKPEQARGQQRFIFKVYRDRRVIDALIELFHGKCAYCEAKVIRTSPIDVEQFRPKSGVTESPDHPGYWWLAGTWENLLASCAYCNRSRVIDGVKTGKANRFPLEDESQRAFAPGKETSERPLLLDPCTDRPEEHLVFDLDGKVSSETSRGQTTIAVLGLNRRELLEARQIAATHMHNELNQLAGRLSHTPAKRRGAIQEEFLETVQAMTAASEEFAGLKRQIARAMVERTVGKSAFAEIAANWDAATPKITPARRRQAQQSQQAFEMQQSDFSLASEKGRETFRMQRRQIEHISIRDFKGIESLEFDLRPGSGRTGWLMLLGENGAGKSSVLQAIALTLIGAKYLRTLVARRQMKLAEYVRSGASQAEVSVKLSGFVGPHRLTIKSNGRATFRKPSGDVAEVRMEESQPKVHAKRTRSAEIQSVLLGYGATRLLPRQIYPSYGIRFARVDNLFDPFLPLFDAELWLLGLDRREFNRVALVLKDLLALDADAELIREKRAVMVRTRGVKIPLRQLSDGYQAVVAMSVDMLEVAIRLWPSLQEAEGIVLLDEIGSHLHPTWKMRIVDSLRKAFPGMQFIASTHDPLCLRGLSEGEVAVMRLDQSGQIEAVTSLPSPADFRVDQLLTSEFFGLNTTTDPDTEKIFDEYYALLALAKPTAVQKQQIETLRDQLKDRRYFGHTLREQLMYEAIDRIVAKQKHAERKPIPQLKQDAVEQLARIWNEGA